MTGAIFTRLVSKSKEFLTGLEPSSSFKPTYLDANMMVQLLGISLTDLRSLRNG